MSTRQVMQYIPLLIPLVMIQYGLAITAIVHMVRHKKFRFGNLPLWIIICLFVNMIGPILYFTLGRAEDE